jgi:hypothetical protein
MDETTSELSRDRLGNLWRGDVLVEKTTVDVDDLSFYCVVCKKAVKIFDAVENGGIIASIELGGWTCRRHQSQGEQTS